VTTMSMVCGFASMVIAAGANSPEFVRAACPGIGPETAESQLLALSAWLIFIAMVFDGLDGRIARLTRQTSEFGVQLDSLSDAISFGAAPAFLAWQVSIHSFALDGSSVHLSRMAFAFCAAYMACAVIRLARFNVETLPQEWAHRWFKGLPSPAAAGVVAAAVLVRLDVAGDYEFFWIGRKALPVIALLAGLMMVSTFRYVHMVTAMFSGSRSLNYFIILILLLTLAVYHIQFSLGLAFIGYALSGPVGQVVSGVIERFEAAQEDKPFY